MELKEKQKQTVTVMGTNLPRWQDCNRCGAELACVFGKFTYDQPCRDCKNTKEYEEEQKAKDRDGRHSMSSMLSAGKVAGVFEHKGRYLYVNNKGNIIKDEKVRPLAVGKKDWK